MVENKTHLGNININDSLQNALAPHDAFTHLNFNNDKEIATPKIESRI